MRNFFQRFAAVLFVLAGHGDTRNSRLALCDTGEQAAEADSQRSARVSETLREGDVGGAVEDAAADEDQKADDEAVKTLRTGEKGEYEHFTEHGAVLGENAHRRLSGGADALCRADTCEYGRDSRAQDC